MKLPQTGSTIAWREPFRAACRFSAPRSRSRMALLGEALWRDGSAGCARSVCFIPASRTRPPATHIPAILFIVFPKFLAQSWFFVKDHEQMYGKANRCGGSNHERVGASEYNPQPD